VRSLAAGRMTACARKYARLRTASVGRLGLRVMVVGLAEVAAGVILLAMLAVLAALVGLGWLAARPRLVVAERRDRLRLVPRLLRWSPASPLARRRF